MADVSAMQHLCVYENPTSDILSKTVHIVVYIKGIVEVHPRRVEALFNEIKIKSVNA